MAWNPKGQEPDLDKEARLTIIEAAIKLATERGDTKVLEFLAKTKTATEARSD